jgi:hypothetical protein
MSIISSLHRLVIRSNENGNLTLVNVRVRNIDFVRFCVFFCQFGRFNGSIFVAGGRPRY